MAKSKHSVALFEVIQSSKTPRRSVADALRTPKWWFKSKNRQKHPAADAAPAPPPAEAPTPVVVDPSALDNAPAPRAAGIDLHVDPDRQRIRFNLSYTTVIVATFSVAVVVAMAYIIGSNIARGPKSAQAGMTTEQLRLSKPRPSVLDVAPGTTVKPAPLIQVEDAAPPQPVAKQPPPQTVSAPKPDEPGQRIIGRQYVLMQSYPEKEKQMAEDACDFLNKNGVPCSVEHSISGYGGWYSVLGLTGFDHRINNPEYDRYIKTVNQAVEKFGNTLKFKKPAPLPYTWKGS